MKNSIIKLWLIIIIFLSLSNIGFSQEDKGVKAALETFKAHVRLPPAIEIKFLEKKESPISNFYAVKFLVILPDKEVPVVVYVDKNGEKVILGNLFIKGENVTMKEAGSPKLKKIDMGLLEMEKSPFIGNHEAKVIIVEFSNFQCPYCMDSWSKLMDLMKRYPNGFKYIFKHFPFEPEGKTFELSELAAAAQEIGNEAFWAIHDFFFTKEGQDMVNRLEKEAVKKKVEQILKGKGYEIQKFNAALETGKARNRVLEDMALANRFRLTSTPTKIINGDMVVGLTPDSTLERYLNK
ncbi:MAG: thioredoxin domain-containing protein [Thermodesulfobacteriota bacterium]